MSSDEPRSLQKEQAKLMTPDKDEGSEQMDFNPFLVALMCSVPGQCSGIPVPW